MRRRRPRSERPPAIVVGALVALLAAGCSKRPRSGSAEDTAATAGSATARDEAPPPPREATIIDFLDGGDACTFGHRGVLLDLGDPSTHARMSGTRFAWPNVELRERDGASWVSAHGRSLELSFVSTSELGEGTGLTVEARVRGGAARSVTVYLNGKPLGTLPLKSGATTLVSARAQAIVQPGTNDVLLRFNGGGRTPQGAFADIDWIRVGPNDGDAPYAAPTRNDAITAVSIGGSQRRAVSLRAPGFARCSAFVPSGSALEGFVGVSGGEAEAEVRVLVDRAEPRTVGTFRLGGANDPPGWRPVSIPLGDVGTIAGVELVATSSTKGARVAFADARVVARPAAAALASPEPPKARGVILVVLGTTSRGRLGVHGGSLPMPELTALAEGGVVFDAHRANSSFGNAALASMLTGVTPREHGAVDPEAALPASVFTVAEAARQAGVVTAMFTANPTTSAPFGFARGWETFTARLPGEDAPATSIFDDAAAWLEAHKADRFFVVVHARGGHPPWDVTSDDLRDLPPSDYQGSLEPNHAGEALAKARKAGGRSFGDPDRERAFALYARALAAHDAELGVLAARLRTLGRDKDTAWIVTGDIGVDATARVPFLDDEYLEEGALAIPLVLRGPAGSFLPGARAAAATSSLDVTPTVLEALGLPPPPRLRGESLWALAARPGAMDRPLVSATATRLSARWGEFAIFGVRDRETKVCNLSLDPDCVSDVRPSHPLAAEVLRSLAFREVVFGGRPGVPSGPVGPSMPPPSPPGDPLTADGPTSAALRAWGR